MSYTCIAINIKNYISSSENATISQKRLSRKIIYKRFAWQICTRKDRDYGVLAEYGWDTCETVMVFSNATVKLDRISIALSYYII